MSDLSNLLSGDDDGDVVVEKVVRAPRKKKDAYTPEQRAELIAKNASAVGKTVRIILEENDNIPPTGQFFGINGKAFVLQPGREAVVPIEIVNVLNDAIMETPEVDAVTRQVIGYRKRLRFPYRLVSSPSE